MRILITNDDGIDSPGINTLATVAAELGHDVIVAAPAWDSSGASASLTGVTDQGRLIVEERPPPAGTGVAMRVIAVEAAPAMIVRAGVRGAFGPAPDAVLSGINDGPNTGHAVLHSGTVGAALTAATHGCRAAAFSVGTGPSLDFSGAGDIARRVIPWLLEQPAPFVLNVNVPSTPPEQVRGICRARLANFGAVTTNVTELGEGYVSLNFTEVDPWSDPGSDATLLAGGWATVTALEPVCERDAPQLDELADPHRSSEVRR